MNLRKFISLNVLVDLLHDLYVTLCVNSRQLILIKCVLSCKQCTIRTHIIIRRINTSNAKSVYTFPVENAQLHDVLLLVLLPV